MAEKAIIYITKETVSDDTYKIGDLYIATGSEIKKGDLVGSIVTSKADIDIEAPESGFVHYTIQKGQEVRVGDVFAIITDDNKFPSEIFAAKSAASTGGNTSAADPSTGNIRISKGAKELIDQHKIDLSVFVNKTLVTKQDVEEYLSGGMGKTNTTTLPEIKPTAKSILIIGGGGHAKVCIDLVRQVGDYDIIGVTDTVNPVGSKVAGVQVLGTNNDFKKLFDKGIRYAAIGIGALTSPVVRNKLYLQLKEIGFQFPNLVHSSAVVEPSAVLGEGNQVMANAYISSDVRIGNNCIINSGCIISHECILGDNVHIAPGAALAGTITVGNNTLVGMNATVLLKVEIGSNVVINNGLNIFKNIPDNTIIRD